MTNWTSIVQDPVHVYGMQPIVTTHPFLCIEHLGSGIVLVSGDKLYISSDNGDTWISQTYAIHGIGEPFTVLHKMTGGICLAGTTSGEVWRTLDYAISWQHIYTFNVHEGNSQIQGFFSNPNFDTAVVYTMFRYSNEMWMSEDFGTTWTLYYNWDNWAGPIQLYTLIPPNWTSPYSGTMAMGERAYIWHDSYGDWVGFSTRDLSPTYAYKSLVVLDDGTLFCVRDDYGTYVSTSPEAGYWTCSGTSYTYAYAFCTIPITWSGVYSILCIRNRVGYVSGWVNPVTSYIDPWCWMTYYTHSNPPILAWAGYCWGGGKNDMSGSMGISDTSGSQIWYGISDTVNLVVKMRALSNGSFAVSYGETTRDSIVINNTTLVDVPHIIDFDECISDRIIAITSTGTIVGIDNFGESGTQVLLQV
jgi:hypothetical protein